MTAQDNLDQAFQQVGTEIKVDRSRITNLEAAPKIGVLLVGDPNPTTPGFWFRETS
jgi:hypothetical protein